jgi:tetratricopeptide (TPR) repeat protein
MEIESQTLKANWFSAQTKNDQATSYVKLSSMALSLGLIELARINLENAENTAPDAESILDARCFLGFQHLVKQHEEKAVPETSAVQSVERTCSEAQQRSHNPLVQMVLAMVHFDLGNFAKAEQQAREVTRLLPLHYEAQLLLARIRAQLGFAPPEVEKQFLRAARLRPYDPTPLRDLISWLNQKGFSERARFFERKLDALPHA